MFLSNSGHDHLRNSVVLFRKKSRNSCAVAPRAQAILFSLCPNTCIWQRLRCVLPLENPLLANMSQQRMERNQLEDIGGSEKKDISRKQGCARISQHKLHHTHVSLFLHHTESVTCSKNTVTCTNRVTPRSVFQTPHTLQVKNARSMSWGAAHERTNAVSSVFFFCLLARPQPRAWTWDNEANSGANDMALCSFFFTCSISWMREEYAQAIHVYGCAMPWCVPRRALLIECSEQHAVSMPSHSVSTWFPSEAQS